MRWRLQLGRVRFVDEENNVLYSLTLSEDGRRWELDGTPLAWSQRSLGQAMEECEGDYWDRLLVRHPPATTLTQ